MGLKIYWTSFAERELENIFTYYFAKSGYDIAKRLVDTIYETTEKLKLQYEIGQKEELLKGRVEEFRYLVIKNYKVIYWINRQENQIEINDVFDTRQSPIKLKRN